jgi:signal transduction histidine kinase
VSSHRAEQFTVADRILRRATSLPPTYRGHDRRAPSEWVSPHGRQLRLAIALLVTVSAVAVYLAATDRDPAGVDLHALNGVLATACAAVAVVAGYVSGLRWRMVGNASSLRFCVALLVLAALVTTAVLVPFVRLAGAHDSTSTRLSAALASTFFVFVVVAVLARPISTRVTTATSVLSAAAVVVVVFGVVWFVPAFAALGRSYRPPLSGGGDVVFHVVVITTWTLLGVIAFERGLRRASWLWTWSGLMLFGFAAAGVLVALAHTDADLWSTGAYALRLLALLFVLNGVGQELKLAYLDQRSRLFDTRRTVEAGEARRRVEQAEREERAHEARSALLGIQAATRQLAESYDGYDVETQYDLRDALEAEIRVLRLLVDGDRGATDAEEFDLAGAINPIVVCHRAAGEGVDTELARGVRVVGHEAVVAEVVQSLLDNARDHAPGASVLVTTRREGARALVRVEDRGPGIAADRVDRIFERGSSTSRSGSGLGLYVVRRLVREMGGDIRVEARRGGGTSFVISLPLGSVRTRQVAGAELVHDADHARELGERDPFDAVGGHQ